MSAEAQLIETKLAKFLHWEKRKHWEWVAASIACYALVAAVALSLFSSLFVPAGTAVWILLGSLLLITPIVIFKQRWRARDVTLSLVQLDKAMRLDERALTAWDCLRRNTNGPATLLVIKQASERLAALDAPALFPRRASWQAYSVLPLLGLWLALLWFDLGSTAGDRAFEAHSLAHKLKEFARQLQEKAQMEGLKQSLQTGKELEKLAARGVDNKSSDDQMKKEIAAAAQKLAAANKQATKDASLSNEQSEQSLRDLKAELEAARDLFNDAGKTGVRDESREWADRLASLPQVRRQLGKQGRGEQMTQGDMRAFLDKMENQVSAELDRRTLLDAEKFLQQMTKQGQGQGDANGRAPNRDEQGAADEGEKGRGQSNRPGSEPGKQTDEPPALPHFPAGPSTQVKGMVGEGASSAMVFKGKPTDGKTAVSQEEVVTSYRRQAEQDLNTERVPEALKETIRNYFLSLGEGK